MREALLNICLTAIGLCLFKMLLPENAMKKQAEFLICCFFLTSLLFFFSAGRVNLANGADFDLVEIEYSDFEHEYLLVKRQAVAVEMRQRLNVILNAEKIYPQEIFTIVNISDKYSISINEIRLVFAKQELTDSDDDSDDVGEEELEMLKKAIHIVQKEVGADISVTGEFKNE